MQARSLAPAVLALVTAQAPRLERARDILAEIERIEAGMMRDRDELLANAWHLGEVLVAMKEDVGHGRWLPFIEGQLPKVGERNARRCMAFFRDNPKSADSADLTFTAESVRKFMWDYIPVKERPELPGDGPVAPVSHHLGFINHFSKWDRQRSQGHIPTPPVDQMRRDFEPVILRQVELLGKDWLLNLIAHVDALG